MCGGVQPPAGAGGLGAPGAGLAAGQGIGAGLFGTDGPSRWKRRATGAFQAFRGSTGAKLWCVVGSLPPVFRKGVYLLDLTALEYGSNGFKYCIWLQTRATLPMAFRAAVHLLAWFVRLRRRLAMSRGRCWKEVAARLGKEFGHGH